MIIYSSTGGGGGGSPCTACSCSSDDPIRYGDGALLLRETDLSFPAFGRPWGHTRSFDNVFHPSHNGINGLNWYAHNAPYLIAQGKGTPSTIVLMTAPQEALWFDRVGATGNYAARFGQKSTIVYDSSTEEYVVTDELGNKTLFYSFTVPEMPGMFKGLLNANGLPSLAFYDSLHRLVSLETTSDGKTSGFYYKFSPEQKSPGKLDSVTLAVNGTSIRRATYSYYGPSDANGLPWDLKNAVIEQYDPTSAIWTTLRTSYYRYHVANSATAYSHGLKYAVGPEAYARLVASGITPEIATDEELKDFADYYFEYDWKRRVTLERVKGGGRTYSFQYESNPAPGRGFNAWVTKTTETLPDGSQNIVYTNTFAQIIAKITRSGDEQWARYAQFDNHGRILLVANSSAIAGYDESNPSVATLHPNKGLVRTSEFYPENDPGGQPYGYLRYERVQEGSNGKPVLLKEYRYAAHSVGYDTIYPISEKISYQSDSGDLSPSVTQYTYDQWHQIDGIDTFQIQQRTTIQPAITTAQNGSNSPNSFSEVFDTYGRRTWLRDQRGFLTATANDPVTGALTQKIDDVSTAIMKAPNNWETPTGGGLHLISDLLFDAFGRQTQSLGPVHQIDLDGTLTSIRQANWTVYRDDLRQTSSAAGYATGSPSNYSFTIVNPVSIAIRDQAGRATDQIEAASGDTSSRLTENQDFPQSTFSRWTKTRFDNHANLVETRQYHLIPAEGEGARGTNYSSRTYGYDSRGRQIWSSTENGTITWNVLNVMGSTLSTWKGTDATGATAHDPNGGGRSGNNMVKVSSSKFDGETAAGDGNQTQVTQYPSTDPATWRTRHFSYDFRNRKVLETGPLGFCEKSTYDNRNRILQVDRYDTSPEGKLLTRESTAFDNQGRILERASFGVDPKTGELGNPLRELTWYDAAGNVIKSREMNGRKFLKCAYDSLGRQIEYSVACNANPESYEQAGSVADNIVLEQQLQTFDPAGNQIFAVRHERDHNATGAGPLRGPNGPQPQSRANYNAFYFDARGRQIASANFGTNGGSSLVRPDLIPIASDTILLSSLQYDKNTGDASILSGPAGRITQRQLDNAGRVTRTIANYQSTANGADVNQTMEYGYSPNAAQASITAVNAITGNQMTQFHYGTTLADSGVANADLLRAKTYPNGNVIHFSYNALGESVRKTDQNGTTIDFQFDLLGRSTSETVTAWGPGVDKAVHRIARAYNQRGLLRSVTSFAGGGSVVNDILFDYDAFGQVLAEYQSHHGAVDPQNCPSTAYSYADGSNNTTRQLSTIYPNGRAFNFAFGAPNGIDDLVDRLVQIVDGANPLIEYTRRGVNSTVRVQYLEPSIEMTYIAKGGEPFGDGGDQYIGLDRFDRIVDVPWCRTGTTDYLEHVRYAFDRANQVLRREPDVPGSGPDDAYQYDGLNRLTARERALSGKATPTSTVPQGENFAYDPTGNWTQYKSTGPSPIGQQRTHNKLNQITAISGTSVSIAHDLVGNLLSAPAVANWTSAQQFTWDGWNRLVAVTQAGNVLASSQYDGLGRRTVKAAEAKTRHYYYSNRWQVLEERLGASQKADRQFLWGERYPDDLVFRDAATSTVKRLYSLHDQWHVTAVTDSAGAIKERYAYSAFGSVTFLDPSFNLRGSSSYEWETLYGAYRFETESSLYLARMRFLHSGLGRWLSPDPFAESQGPNPYTYVENNPTGAVDPSGAYTLTANGPPATPQLCGGVNKNVTWTINGQPAIVGAIIQQITLMADIYSCTGANSPKSCNIIHWQNGDQSPVTFWEVWNVNTPVQNNFNIGFNNDLWRLPSCPCTYGDFWILGTATFYSNLLVTLPPAWPFRPSGSGGSSYSGPGQLSATGAWSKTIQTAITNAIQYAAQQLQGTPGYPQITSSPPLSRSLGGTWYCCPNPSDAENTNIIDDSPS